ncbi:RNA-binding protein Nova-2-like [Dorcoceras hygrometricum]|uniref:RNA-binding protein Nova-2-like n=1 Tax=Dorcoceras hygrometricum TaxID=472368 RepID=A0A2Z7C0A8_9LAMI|nr:RNA-binding protein Nova-2-like [Dorcoceras hygrometricum]
MSSPSDSIVNSMTALVDRVPPSPETKEPWLPDQDELSSVPWYEEKSSTLKLSDISIIKEKGGMMVKFERRSPWRCDMSWRDNVYTLAPRTPDRSSNLTSFLEAMRGKSYNAPELIKEDLLCFFGFSRKGVDLVGDLAKRMGKAAMLEAWDEAVGASSGTAVPPTKVAKKREASTHAEKEAHRQKKKKGSSTSEARGASSGRTSGLDAPIPMTDECPDPTPIFNIPEVSSPERGSMKESGPRRVPPLNYFEDSLIVAWGGEVIKRLTRAQREANDHRHLFVEAMGNHAELVAQLEELKSIRAQEKKAAQEALRAQLLTERAARTFEEEAMWAELEVALKEKTAVEAELEEAKSRAEEEIGRLRIEAANAWDVGKEEFLKSSEFDNLCTKKFVSFFRAGFERCVAQLRANGYSEEEHPISFLSIRKGLEELPDDIPEAEEEEEEGEVSGDESTPPSPPKRIVITFCCIVNFGNLMKICCSFFLPSCSLNINCLSKLGGFFMGKPRTGGCMSMWAYSLADLLPERVESSSFGWGCHPRRCQCIIGLKCRAGRAYVCVEELREEWPVRNWAYVLSWSGLCAHVEELRKEWLVRNWALALRWGCHPRRCQCGTGLRCRAGRAYALT